MAGVGVVKVSAFGEPTAPAGQGIVRRTADSGDSGGHGASEHPFPKDPRLINKHIL